MPQYAAVSRDRHAGQRWKRFESYHFAATSTVATIVAAEFSKAMMAFPLAFMEENGVFTPVAVFSIEPQQNLFVAPDGRWIGSYVPAILRGYPFRLIPNEGGELLLCVDEESDLIADGDDSEAFFDADGSIAEPTKRVLDFLSTVEKNRQVTTNACLALRDAGVISPWEITLKSDAGERKVQGLFRINETALNKLPAEQFETLRQAGALPLAFCQMLSMQHLPSLGKLAEAHAAHRNEETRFLKESFTESNQGEIDIDWSMFSDDSKT